MNLWFLRFYLLLHISFIGFAVSDLPWKIDADMYSVLPQEHILKDIGKAEQKWSKNNSANFMILVGSENFDKAKDATLLLYNEFAKDSSLQTFEIFTDSNAVQDLRNFFFKNRMKLQTEEFVQTLDTDVSKIRSISLSKIYGANPLISLENLDDDPFLLSENGMERIMSSQMLGAWEIEDNLRVTNYNGINYILITGKLAQNVSPIADKKNVVSRIRKKAKEMEGHDLRIALSGIPFHVNESSENAGKEVAIITAISISSVILLLFFVFRSAVPVIAASGITILSALFAASAVHIIFGEIHIFALVFGTSIIGLSLDYSIHFFSHWKMASANENGFDVRSKIILCLALGFLTTQLGYITLITTQAPLLKQIAVFSIFGLLSAFLSVNVLFPYFKLPPQNKRVLPLAFFQKIVAHCKIGKPLRIAASAVIVIVAALALLNPKIENKLQEFYTMSKELQNSEMLAAKIMNMGTGLFYIVKGNFPEETLENEEYLRSHLDTLCSYLAASTFVPSAKSQARVYNSINKNLLPLYAEQLMQIGFDSISAKNRATILTEKFQKDRDRTLNFSDRLPTLIQQTFDKLWIGEIDGKYYSAVLILKTKDREYIKNLQIPNAILIDKKTEIEMELNVLSKKIIIMMLVAYAISLLFLSFIYNLKSAVKNLAVPLLASALAVSIMSAMGLSISFFAISGTVLTLAIGIDYSLFFSLGKGNRDITLFAVFLSMLTTVLSFGLLSFSNFAPVSQLGISVSVGIILCFLLSFFLLFRRE
ncbi:MAG: MMPL family transporter [Fibromonadales bacterium]|nr:MMPL family transporter [Fibromonadales bacterium]